jgi:excisionase family DNA binding protein
MKTDAFAYSISETCKLTSLGRTTLYAAIKNGDLKTCKVGRRTLITAVSLQQWLGNLPRSKTAEATIVSGDDHE